MFLSLSATDHVYDSAMRTKRDTLESRSAERRRTATARLLTRDADTLAFNIEFWRAQGPDARLAAAWDMVLEARRMRGQRGPEPRLQRSVAVLVRRAR